MAAVPTARPKFPAAGLLDSKARLPPILSRRASGHFCLQSRISELRFRRSCMRKPSILVLCVVGPLLLSSCSPRDFLTRRLAADLIASSSTFRAAPHFELTTGIISNQEYLSPKYLALQHRGWISGVVARCPPAVAPPCWDVTLTPSGVDTFQGLLAPGDAKQGNVADVEFTWRWIPLNEVGAIMYSGDVHYRTTATFRSYDDGWRIVEAAAHSPQPLDEALRNAEPMQ